ncbi:zinc finger E-box-binding homeobox 1-like isoform X2 [Antennarius striatus]|uniref:zinc finger E-box-binding homeobox 1-like isoform X2 n=1 Tax=Antennarius striatus TaxID=241820 RepID=UPI0035B0AFE3
MADGPRCKRRKQANPKRSSVTNFNNGLEASSDSDDEDKLHIVEEDSLLEPDAANAAGTPQPDRHDAANATANAATVLPHNGSVNGVKEECVSEDEEEEEEEEVKDTLVEEILQQGDTAIIYPEAPEDEQSPAEAGGADENGTPDSFSQLHTCPYCSRGYKRNASLKEHIKYRHETSDDNYSCSHCSYTFTYRSQLERHMNHHRGSREQRHTSQSTGGTGGTRKFKCTECSKAFKYKHHLKEHLRIHSGEKPYECSNCKKRFSHSGSYSSHISSKKCVGAAPPNGVPRTLIKSPTPCAQMAPVVIAPARTALKEKPDSKPLQEQLPLTQIKSEPVEYECKLGTPATSSVANGVVNGGTAPAAAAPQGVAMVVPTMGLMSPISINLNDLQNVLKVAMDGNVLRQVLGTANGVVTQGKQGIVVQQPQQQIISLPAFVDHDGTTKIIINYSISPAAAAATAAQPHNPTPTVSAAAAPAQKTGKSSTPDMVDLNVVKTEPESVAVTQTETVKTSAAMPKAATGGSSTCLLCDDCPDNLEALHLLQHRKAANGEAVDSAALDPSFADLLSEAGVTLEEPPVEDLLSLLKTYFASNANPNETELEKISESVSIPVDVVRKWFAKMNCGRKLGKESKKCENGGSVATVTLSRTGEAEEVPNKDCPSSFSLNAGDLVIVKREPEDPNDPDSQAEPLDLSLPKHLASDAKATPPPLKQQDQPLNLTCLRKEQLEGRTIYVAAPQKGRPVNIVTAAQLPTLVAIAGQGAVGCLGAINTKRTILIPQLTYTYATPGGGTAGAKTVVLNGHKQEKKPDSGSDGVPAGEEPSDSDSAVLTKKRRLENGSVYPCDLCSKVFQKGSSLLRHKYEHTGRRPHECSICNKAFKHKHHLIEHSRLHSGEKPYQCDKCGKRFSHSGSYSQHMNHRYSYCKKDDGLAVAVRRVPPELGGPGVVGLLPDSRTTTPPSQLDSDERDSEEEEEDEDEEEEAMCMDDIRVVQVDDGECEIYEGNFDDDDEMTEEEVMREEEAGKERGGEEFVCDVVEVELGDDHVRDEEMEEVSEEKEETAEKDEAVGEKEEAAEEMEEVAEEKEEAVMEKEEAVAEREEAVEEEEEEAVAEKEEAVEEKEEAVEEKEEAVEEKEEAVMEKEEAVAEREEAVEEKEEAVEEKEEAVMEKEEAVEEKEEAVEKKEEAVEEKEEASDKKEEAAGEKEEAAGEKEEAAGEKEEASDKKEEAAGEEEVLEEKEEAAAEKEEASDKKEEAAGEEEVLEEKEEATDEKKEVAEEKDDKDRSVGAEAVEEAATDG